MRAHDRRHQADVRIIGPKKGLAFPHPRVIWDHRSLLAAFIRRDIKVHYQQTILGPLWMIVQPVVTTIILATMLTRVVNLPTENQPAPLFYLAAMIMWSYFTEVVLTVSQVFILHEYLFGKVAFPRILLPISTAISNLIGTGLQLVMLGLLVAVLVIIDAYDADLGHLWVLPLSFPFLIAMSLGLGLFIASSTTRYRDLANAVPFALQSGFLLTPILFPYSMVPEPWRQVYAVLNPLSVLSDLWRGSLTGTSIVASAQEIVGAAASAFAIFAVGAIAFQSAQRTAADTI